MLFIYGFGFLWQMCCSLIEFGGVALEKTTTHNLPVIDALFEQT